MNRYLQQPEKYMKHFSYLLIVLGIFDTVMIYLAFKNNTSYSGGSIFYIYLGFRLLKKDARMYKRIRIGILFFLPLISGLIFSEIFLQLSLIYNISNINYSFNLKYWDFFSLVFILIVPTYSVLLWKRETLIYYSDISSKLEMNKFLFFDTCLEKKYINLIYLFCLIVPILFLGPNIYRNPFNDFKDQLMNNSIISFNNNENIIKVRGTSVFNWNVRLPFTIDNDTNIYVYSYNPIVDKSEIIKR